MLKYVCTSMIISTSGISRSIQVLCIVAPGGRWSGTNPVCLFYCSHSGYQETIRLCDHLSQVAEISQLVNCAIGVPDVDSHTTNCLDLLLITDPARQILGNGFCSARYFRPLSGEVRMCIIIPHLKNPLVARFRCGDLGQQTGMRSVTSRPILGEVFVSI